MMADHLQHPDLTAVSRAAMPTPDRLIETATAFWRSAVLVSADELGLFAALAAGPCDTCSLAGRLGLRSDAAADFLESLVALGLLERHGEQFRNAPEASLYLDPAAPAYIGHWLAMAGAAMRDMVDLTMQLRAADANEQRCPSLADRMWVDIAEILRTGDAHGDTRPA